MDSTRPEVRAVVWVLRRMGKVILLRHITVIQSLLLHFWIVVHNSRELVSLSLLMLLMEMLILVEARGESSALL